ncbi:MAG: AAA family ATPase [Bryobacteraceae bacterium]|nr:AAA family ATPase [Bryobacteraceae bacterium]
MAEVAIEIPGYGTQVGEAPIVLLGPNGSGKTQLAQKIARAQSVCAISAQRRTWVDDNLPVQDEQNLRSHTRSQQDRWRDNAWQQIEDFNFILSTLVQEHTNQLTLNNENAIACNEAVQPVRDSKLMLLQGLWSRLFPKRKLEVSGFFPRVRRLDGSADDAPYHLRQMSDGERTILYMAARVLTAEYPVILVDEPELHMHSRLSVKFWDEAEKLRPDCRFLYVTYDLNFALSRRRATVLIAKLDGATSIVMDEVPSSVATEVLGAATLPFYAKRIFLFEGEQGKGFASEFFSVWFDDDETFTIPSGNRDSVCSAVSGLKTVGLVAADVIGLVDRDFYSDEVLRGVTAGVTVLPVHEIESVLCDQHVVKALASYLGKEPSEIWNDFLNRVRTTFQAKTLNNVVARRVRSRVGDLLDGAFTGAQVVADAAKTGQNHQDTLVNLDLPSKVGSMFAEESRRVADALAGDGTDLLAILPGKHALDILSSVLGLSDVKQLTGLVTSSLDRRRLKPGDSIHSLGHQIETALLLYLPPRIA